LKTAAGEEKGMGQRDGKPLWISEALTKAHLLERVDLRLGAEMGGYDEAWLQRLLYNTPEVLPVEQIEPGFGKLIPLCRELPLTFGGGRSGALDNLFVTKDGHLVLVETKLWRNPEARRTVVAQAMEYAAAVFRLGYEDFESAVLRARASDPKPPVSIYDIVKMHDKEVDEPEFVDAVSRNLKRGRAIIGVVGDGIREDVAPLAELLQTHAGHRFTFALIELAVYQAPQDGVRILMPSVLAQTALIERGVVQIEDGRVIIKDPAPMPGKTSRERSFGIGEDEFYEALEQRAPGASALLKSFLARAKTLGVEPDLQRGLNLKHVLPGDNDLNLGTIDKGGFLDTGTASWWGRTDIARRYNEHLAAQIRGFVRDYNDGKESAVRTAAGKRPRLLDFLPAHEEAWLHAIERYIRESERAVTEPEEREGGSFGVESSSGVHRGRADQA
jgi:hypothetical protein